MVVAATTKGQTKDISTLAYLFLSPENIDSIPHVALTKEQKEFQKKEFILNSQDFRDLQRYLLAGRELPSTPSLFEADYPKDNLLKFMEKDIELYDKMREVFPRVYQRCQTFQTETIEPMTILGGKIYNYSKFAAMNLVAISGLLAKMTADGVSTGDAIFKSSQTAASKLFERLQVDSDKTTEDCKALANQLSDFKAATEKPDKSDLLDIRKRLTAAVPNEGTTKAVIQNYIDAARKKVADAQARVDSQKAGAAEERRIKWYYFINPIAGIIMATRDQWDAEKLEAGLAELNAELDKEKKNCNDAESHLALADGQVNLLQGELNGVGDTIEGAIKAVDKMNKTFVALSTAFASAATAVKDAKSDVDTDDTVAVLEPIIEMNVEDAVKSFQEIQIYAKAFQEQGIAKNVLNPTA